MSSNPATRLEALLDQLCADYGYCLPPGRQAEILMQPPQDVDAFVDAVLEAEGLDPSVSDRRNDSSCARSLKSGSLTKA